MADAEKGPAAKTGVSAGATNERTSSSPQNSVVMTRVSSATDEAVPAKHQHEFSLLSAVGLAFAILNSWTAMAASLSLALPSGGPTSVIWGVIVSGIGDLCIAASLAEICEFSRCLYRPMICIGALVLHIPSPF